MCVIVVKDEGQHLRRETFRKLWDANPDGGGFSVIENDGTLTVVKSMFKKQLWREWRKAQERLGNPKMILHLRIATHGKVSIENVHPFEIPGQRAVLYHNGASITCAIPYPGDERSDSRVFAEEILSRLPENWQDNEYLADMVEDAVGASNKLAIHSWSPDRGSEITILNREGWEEYEGLLMSNTYGLTGPRTYTTYAKGSSWQRNDAKILTKHATTGWGSSWDWGNGWSWNDEDRDMLESDLAYWSEKGYCLECGNLIIDEDIEDHMAWCDERLSPKGYGKDIYVTNRNA